MARQANTYCFRGRIDALQFYIMDGKGYVRMVSSLTGKKVRTHKAFARSRVSYERMDAASPIASEVYWQLPEYMRIDGYFNAMVGVVNKLLKEGYTAEQAGALLREAADPSSYEALREADLGRGGAAGIGASVYAELPVAMQVVGYEQALADMAVELLEEGFTTEDAYELLWKAAAPGRISRKDAKECKEKKEVVRSELSIERKAFADAVLKQVFAIPIDEYMVIPDMYCDMPP